jgi:hypothetical protein
MSFQCELFNFRAQGSPTSYNKPMDIQHLFALNVLPEDIWLRIYDALPQQTRDMLTLEALEDQRERDCDWSWDIYETDFGPSDWWDKRQERFDY